MRKVYQSSKSIFGESFRVTVEDGDIVKIEDAKYVIYPQSSKDADTVKSVLEILYALEFDLFKEIKKSLNANSKACKIADEICNKAIRDAKVAYDEAISKKC